MTTKTKAVGLAPRRPPKPILNAFFLPRGILGYVGGFLMSRGVDQQGEIADLITAPGSDLCELGSGPGLLAAVLADRHPHLRLHLVDPSPVMRSQAARRCARFIDAGLVSVNDGTAESLPLAAGSCDTLVAVNSILMWPDLAAGLAEISRVLRPGGTLVLSWHSPAAPSSASRRLALTVYQIAEISAALTVTFSGVQRIDLVHSVAWVARRRG
ncbi:class I SAM-dependent methyltransferase [Cryobacterium sinapicolor]|uniref:Class I SAM-dependent methyltransferase n=1 Tax=Cryobacterium sinapicolor TaxID=1259236 RepID=A0ABY2IZ79_9MICO|nr:MULTISPECIES: class I SAM-dependent methyltransferase [Cryobacterium]TFC85032.1 class I SAM-dependent methyltransferase [Cryobacterium sp. TMT3-29-2]TFC97712.1 class I SAM-dependent methyltransferase [Cryobacterium sinapicolor]